LHGGDDAESQQDCEEQQCPGVVVQRFFGPEGLEGFLGLLQIVNEKHPKSGRNPFSLYLFIYQEFDVIHINTTQNLPFCGPRKKAAG